MDSHGKKMHVAMKEKEKRGVASRNRLKTGRRERLDHENNIT